MKWVIIIIVVLYSMQSYDGFAKDHPWLSQFLPGDYTSQCTTITPAGWPNIPNPFATPKTPIGVQIAQKSGEFLYGLATQPMPSASDVETTVGGGIHQMGVMVGVFNRAAHGYVPPKDPTWWQKLWGTAAYETPTCGTCPAPGVAAPTAPPVQMAAMRTWSPEQTAIAETAIQVAHQNGIPDQGVVVALAAGLQESGLQDLDHGMQDSVGWLQQRASWGTVAQRMDPAYAAGKFYAALVKVPGWQSMSVNAAAQAVQISGTPTAYGPHEAEARAIFATVSGSTPTPSCTPAAASGGTAAGTSPAVFDQQGNPRTVDQAIAWEQAMVDNQTPIEVGTCEAVVTHAYGYAGGPPSAYAHWLAVPASDKVASATDVPPRGSLVFWYTGAKMRDGSEAGHVALSIGGGYAITSDPNGHSGRLGVVPLSELDGWGPRLGWTIPVFPGNGKVGNA